MQRRISPSPAVNQPRYGFHRNQPMSYRFDRPPEKPIQKPPNFIVQLCSTHRVLTRPQLNSLISKLPFTPQNSFVFSSGFVVGTLLYEQWNQALDVTVELWKLKLKSEHFYTPFVKENIEVSSDKEELNNSLKGVFLDHLYGILDGVLVQIWEQKLGFLMNEIDGVSSLLRKHNRIGVYGELCKKRKGLEAERDLIKLRIDEFKNGIKCIIQYLEEGGKGFVENEEGFRVLKFGGEEFDWDRIHCLMMRECRRLDDGLPIFAFRQQILKQIHCQQVTVLVGETGSGKSTQLVQFLADSGIAGNGSMICTQPRKLAANSLARRVREESQGCYDDNSVTCNPSYSSCQQFDSKIIFMTDHCLLQHYMGDKTLSKISCIIVDEAHERSLNTDLLLALIKNLLHRRFDLRLIIMSATVDADQLADYFFGCGTFHVAGRTFPVDIKYVPCESDVHPAVGAIASYVHDVIKMVTEIHRTEGEGAILAFLTSQSEVEWACDKFQAPLAIVLPLHGKLTYDDQNRVFLFYPGRRKVIFTTNLAETSLTIPGVKYVVDSGVVKESRFEPGTGMNVLRICSVSQSSANQRAGRAGRTEPGKCYRLYSQSDFEGMPCHQEPEIRKVHLGVAVLRILALGIKNVQDFDFVDAPSPKAIEMATRNLVQLGAVTQRDDDTYVLTAEGRKLVKLGIEPRLGKMILGCFDQRMGREGVVLAAVMANSSSIFCRVGSEGDKLKSDRLKVQFCHPNGDLFTLLSVYREWEAVPREKKNSWCWDNSINAKSMRRCQETVQELEACLQNELNMIIASYWQWDPQVYTKHDEVLQSIILSSLAENVAMYSGYDQLGYEVALTGKCVQLHPACSLLNFAQRPRWVVFGQVLASTYEYLVCVTSFEFSSLYSLNPVPLFDFLKMDAQKLEKKVLTGFGVMLLKRFCGKSNCNINNLVTSIRTTYVDERIGIQVNVDDNEVLLYASSRDMKSVTCCVNDALEYESKLLQNECLEKCLFSGGSAASASIALFGAGAMIKHLELEKRCLTVDIFHSNGNAIDDKELLMFLEKFTSGSICAVYKSSGMGQDSEENKWGRVTFLTPDAAKQAAFLDQVEFNGGFLKVVSSRSSMHGSDQKMFRSALRAKVQWPRKYSRGVAFLKCHTSDVAFMINDFSDLMIGERIIRCEPSNKYPDNLVISGIDKEISEAEILEVLRASTNRRVLDLFLVRGTAVEDPPVATCEEALRKVISPFMPNRIPYVNSVRVQVFQPEPKDAYTRAAITFDGSLHLEAAKALEQIDGKVLPGCLSWQKIRCQQLFHSSVSCPAPVYHVIRNQLDSLLASLRRRNGVECNLVRNDNGSYRVKISAIATKVVAEMRRPLEQLMKGKIVDHVDITPTVVQLLFSREGTNIMNRIQRETGTYILFDKHNLLVRIFGSSDNVDRAQQRLIDSLLALHESKQLEVHLRGQHLPPDLMKRVVQTFGPDLNGLKEKVPGAEFSLNTKRHCICINGSKDLKQKVEDLICEISQRSGPPTQTMGDEADCPVCLCELEDPYRLEACAHLFCRSCLLEQCESAIKSREGFPVCCMRQGCREPILLADLKSLLSSDKLEELFRASLGAFVAANGGTYRFCPSPDCPSIYRVADPGMVGEPFVCGACFVETCTRCHLEYHPYLSCEMYQEFKNDPDSSLKEWSKGKENVKKCPVCSFTIEKIDGCNHIECRCGKHVCWVCLEFFDSSENCYGHLRNIHLSIT
ncbi:ATP-dependent RNA helicase DEAH11, chloroplastic-like [Nicotiana tomentosiformis]|uniref:ATP-dependent RNA helicase DEAH11, chloroplastic-like n=1 Tax=Nicotiana tomentosiformis TaxID=4098 RepID=UPI00051C1F35|nr:ATP-dependent RNA helicase DEAH11, chloroplastic-like [Nicotiana tomentosiformis]